MAKRHANGEGSIRKRKDGRWEGRYTAGRDPKTGKTIYKNVLGKTQAEVKAKLKAPIEENANLDIYRQCPTEQVVLSALTAVLQKAPHRRQSEADRVQEAAQGTQRQDSAEHQSCDLLSDGFREGSEADCGQPGRRLCLAEAGAQGDENSARRAADILSAGGEGDQRL